MTAFYRLSGAGNDFLALVEPDRAPSPDRIRRWCRRGLGIGADGLLVLTRRPGEGELALTYYNRDGGEAALCVNGTRCAARLADHLGWSRGSCRILTRAGLVPARAVAPTIYATELPPPAGPPRPVRLEVGGESWTGDLVDVGVPHLVCRLDHDPGADFEASARPLRHHVMLGEAGANVDFAIPSGDGTCDLRSFERGVEGETLACGTGVLAAAAVAIARGWSRLPFVARTRGGYELRVEGRIREDRVETWELVGDARLLAVGAIQPEADLEPT